MLVIWDANGYRWTFDAEKGRVYCIDDMPTNPEELEQNGYICDNWGQAVGILNDCGYME